MGEFFQGRRRKIGVLTLVMACVFMAGWVRSWTIADHFNLPDSRQTSHLLWSGDGRLGEIRVDQLASDGPLNVSLKGWRYHSERRSVKRLEVELKENNFQSTIDSCGFYVGTRVSTNPQSSRIDRIWCFPYWSIVIPLTLISAYLLLVKPRHSTTTKTDEPIPETVT